MKRNLSIIILIAFIFVQALTLSIYKVKADGTDCLVRVEGLTGTIAYGSVSGDNGLDAAEEVLKEYNIEYTAQEGSFSEISGLGQEKIASAAWGYYVKTRDSIKTPEEKLGAYIPSAGEEIVIYYTDTTVPFLKSVEFINDHDKDFKIRFMAGSEGIPEALVRIDEKNYVTDLDGEIDFPDGLEPGKYTYDISGYNSGRLSSVVMDKGTFTISEQAKPLVNYTDSSFEGMDTSSDRINAAADSIKSYSDPFAYVSLNKLNMDKNINYIRSSYDKIKNYGVDSCSNGELESIIIAAAACGYSPYDFAGCSLPAVLFSRSINTYGTDDLVFGLIAINYGNIQDTYSVNRKALKEKLLEKELRGENNTGWSLKDSVDPYITGAAISALSPYYSETAVKEAVDNAVKTLDYLQDEDGFIRGNGGINSETLAFVITGLISVGVNPEGITILQDGTLVNFAKPKGDLVTAMLSFIQEDGTFKRTEHGLSNTAATEQCLRALISLFQYKISGNAYNYYSSKLDSSALKIYAEILPSDSIIDVIKGGSIAASVAVPETPARKSHGSSSSDKANSGNKPKSTNRIFISVGGLILVIGIIGIASQAVNRRD